MASTQANSVGEERLSVQPRDLDVVGRVQPGEELGDGQDGHGRGAEDYPPQQCLQALHAGDAVRGHQHDAEPAEYQDEAAVRSILLQIRQCAAISCDICAQSRAGEHDCGDPDWLASPAQRQWRSDQSHQVGDEEKRAEYRAWSTGPTERREDQR
jgi:hypothetical protein